ncbi:unnamed protein product [Protopolystoma xenopodis]|uniref:Uncharacterized protein n=1 Tax=Protopolystoma xenopodis TaxID=117903 RepID=A0A3S5CG31_9PLAT|nr:unnamed protein product [Protopolystoma xenopodis]
MNVVHSVETCGKTTATGTGVKGSLWADAVAAQIYQAWLDYTDRLSEEWAAETERLARQQVLAEQEAAYAESLRLDRLKVRHPLVLRTSFSFQNPFLFCFVNDFPSTMSIEIMRIRLLL